MANSDGELDGRAEMVEMLPRRVAEDTFPSGTMLDFIEDLATEEQLETYASVLWDKINASTYPSVPMMRRLIALFPPPS